MNDWAPSLEWKFQTSTDKDLDAYRWFWGDEYRWTALLPLGWKAFDISEFAIKVGKHRKEDFPVDSRGIALWSMAIHLLALGMGWNDIALGLKRWRENRYAKEWHPILDFLLNTFGANIGALEVYFSGNQRLQLAHALRSITDLSVLDHSSTQFHDDNLLISQHSFDSWVFDPDLSDEDFFFDIVKPLLEPGDAFHLEPHVCESITPEARDTDEPWVRQIGNSQEYKFQVNKYAGWARQLSSCAELEQYEEDGTRVDLEINVSIDRFGNLGTFILNRGTGRYFLFSETYGAPSLQWDAHRWGHSN